MGRAETGRKGGEELGRRGERGDILQLKKFIRISPDLW